MTRQHHTGAFGRFCLLLLSCLMAAAAGTGCTQIPADPAAPAAAGLTLVEETGLLEAEELPADTFAFEIMPDADEHIAEIRIRYAGGPDAAYLGDLELVPETDPVFTRQDTFRRGFTVPDRALLEDFTLSFVLVDENGRTTAAENEYRVDAEYGVMYFLKIGGSREEGYVLETR